MDVSEEITDPRFPDGLPEGCSGLGDDDPRIVGEQGGEPWSMGLTGIVRLRPTPEEVIGLEVSFLDFTWCLTADQFRFLALRGLDMLGIENQVLSFTHYHEMLEKIEERTKETLADEAAVAEMDKDLVATVEDLEGIVKLYEVEARHAIISMGVNERLRDHFKAKLDRAIPPASAPGVGS